jgi:hypothetical protein
VEAKQPRKQFLVENSKIGRKLSSLGKRRNAVLDMVTRPLDNCAGFPWKNRRPEPSYWARATQ